MARTFQPASKALAELFARAGMKRRLKRAEAVLLWPQVVGSVARFSTAKRLQEGVLIVEVQDSETAMHLTHQRHRFIDAYHTRFGVSELKDIRFRVGRPSPAASVAAATPSPEDLPAPDPKALAELAKNINTLDLPEALATSALQAAKAMLRLQAARRAQGQPSCPTCGTIIELRAESKGTSTGENPPKLCRTCTRYSTLISVQRASQMLAVNPDQHTPNLSEDERAVAVYMAMHHLEARIDELLPFVLAEPQHKVVLEAAVRCYLAHRLHKPLSRVTEDDFRLLEPQLQRLLGLL
ncbi:MAG: DUF721 domain-containing protein [Deinococcota bacterium]